MDTKQGQNSIIEYLRARDPELMDKIISTFDTCRKLDFLSIKQSDIMVLTPEQAYEYKGKEGDKYFKIWMAGDKIAWCTWANSMIDSRFRWNSKESDPEEQRNNTDILGNEPYISEFIKSWSAMKKCTTVYMFPFTAFSERSSIAKKAETKKKTSTEKNNDQKIEELIDSLSKLSTSIVRQIESDWACSDNITDFQNKLMRLKCLDETNKMIPYFEQMSKDWPQQTRKQKKGLITSIIEFLYN